MSHSGPMTNDDDAEIQVRYKNSRRMSSIPVRLAITLRIRTGFWGLSLCQQERKPTYHD